MKDQEITELLAQMAHGADRNRAAQLLGLEAEGILDFSSNINPYGFTPAMHEALATACEQVPHYPDPQARALVEALAQRRKLETWQIIPGNGGADVIFRLAGVLGRRLSASEVQRTSEQNLTAQDETRELGSSLLRRECAVTSQQPQVLLTAPTFSEYAQAFSQAGFALQAYPLTPAQNFQLDRGILETLDDSIQVCILCQPNNPTGLVIEPELLTEIRRTCYAREIYLAMDECFLDFLAPQDQAAYSLKAGLSEREIIIKSLTKLFALPGLRLGWLELGSPRLAGLLKAATPPWQVSGPAQAVGLAALATPEAEIQGWRRQLVQERQRLSQALTQAGARVYPSQANFLFFAWDYPTLQLDLLTQFQPPILVRNCANYPGLGPGYWRVAVKRPEENDQLIRALQVLREKAHA